MPSRANNDWSQNKLYLESVLIECELMFRSLNKNIVIPNEIDIAKRYSMVPYFLPPINGEIIITGNSLHAFDKTYFIMDFN